MTQFEFTVFRQSRVLIGLFLFMLSIVISIKLSCLIEYGFLKIVFPIIVIGSILGLSIYFAYGKLKVLVDNENLVFKFEKKIIFNYRQLKTISLKDIQTIVLDDNSSIRMIITEKNELIVENNKSKFNDSISFIEFLRNNTGARFIDSWDVLLERGYLNLIYNINRLILFLGVLLLTIGFIIKKGFSSHHLLFVIGGLVTLFSYQVILKDKLNKNWW